MRETAFIGIGIRFVGALVLVSVWTFSSWPRLWHNPSFPSEVDHAEAAVGNIGPKHDVPCKKAVIYEL